MKTFLAVLFGMVLWQLIHTIMARRYEAKVEKMKKTMVQFKDKDGITYIDAELFEVTVADGYEATTEGNKITIRKKKKNAEDVQ